MELSLTDFVAYLLAAGVNADSESHHIELLTDFLGIAVELVGYRQNLDLLGSEPQRERAGKVLGDNADEALDRTENNAVNHDRAMLLAVRTGVFKLEALGQLHIELDGAALPCSAERIGQMEVELRSVECAVALVDDKVLAHLGDRRFESLGREIPVFLVAHVILGHGRDFDLIGQTEHGIDLIKQADNALYLVLHLIPCHEDMRVILSEAAHAEQTMERTGQLVAVNQSELAHSQGQVAV